MGRLLSVVISVYNEEKALEESYRETTEVSRQVSWGYELFFVNDGSRDGSQDILDRLATSDSGVRAISFSRNFGHEAAMVAGLDYSRGDGIICMDTDPQHPPRCISNILTKLGEGCQVISMVRIRNRMAGLVKNIISSGFYRLISRISDVHLEANAFDFFVASRHITQVLKDSYREKVRFLRGRVQNMGFKKVVIEHEARTRVAGESKYSIKELFMFSINTILYFSNMPLKLGIYVDIFSALLGFVIMIYTLYTGKGAPSDYTIIVVLVYSMFAMMFVIIGTIGKYIAILLMELEDRPIYIVDRMENMDQGKNVDQIASITDRTENRDRAKNARQKESCNMNRIAAAVCIIRYLPLWSFDCVTILAPL